MSPGRVLIPTKSRIFMAAAGVLLPLDPAVELARLRLAGLLALDRTVVAREETRALQHRAIVWLELLERTTDAEADRAGLA